MGTEEPDFEAVCKQLGLGSGDAPQPIGTNRKGTPVYGRCCDKPFNPERPYCHGVIVQSRRRGHLQYRCTICRRSLSVRNGSEVFLADGSDPSGFSSHMNMLNRLNTKTMTAPLDHQVEKKDIEPGILPGVSEDDEIELLGEQDEVYEGRRPDELTEDQIDNLLGDSPPPAITMADSQEYGERTPSPRVVPGRYREEDEDRQLVIADDDGQETTKEISAEAKVEVKQEQEKQQTCSVENGCFKADALFSNEEEHPCTNKDDDDVCMVEPQASSRVTTPIPVLLAEEPMNETVTVEEDDILVEEPVSTSTEPLQFNRLAQQMFRVQMEQFVTEDPTAVFIHKINSELDRLRNLIRVQTLQLSTLRQAHTQNEHELTVKLTSERHKTERLNVELQNARMNMIPQVRSEPNYPSQLMPRLQLQPPRPQTFNSFKRSVTQTLGSRARSYQPYDIPVASSPSKAATQPPAATATITVSPAPIVLNQSAADSSTGHDLPNRISISVALLETPRQCTVNDPFDGMPLRDYPPGLLKPLGLNGTGKVEVVLNTEYDSFLISKKLHGVVKYRLPEGVLKTKGASVRIYYWVESLHHSWTHSQSAKLSDSGSTKFTMSFHSDQKLYQGDRVSFIGFVFVDQTTKYVSEQAIFRMRRPRGPKSDLSVSSSMINIE